MAAFERRAVAEAKVHGTTVDKIHFHEVGAVDALVDFVGTCWGIESLGVEEVYASPLPLGRGSVRTEHGLLPVLLCSNAFFIVQSSQSRRFAAAAYALTASPTR